LLDVLAQRLHPGSGLAARVATVSSLFEGFPAELIARWCGVSVKTARLYKAGVRRPSRQALRLFTLYRDERVLCGPWGECSVRGEHLVDPDGQTVTVGQLRAYWIVMALAAELARRAGPDAQERYYEAIS
jgi:hypothetical protein